MGISALQNVSGQNTLTKVRMLVLDDDAFDRKRVRRWIERTATVPVHLVEAMDLKQFAAQIAEQTFDVVLLDYGLSDGTGLDAVKTLRQQSRNAACQTVMISGRDDRDLRSLCLSMGCDQFMSKNALDASKINDILGSVSTGRTNPDPIERASHASALDYWSARANQRSDYLAKTARSENRKVLQDVFGIDLSAMPVEDLQQKLDVPLPNRETEVVLRGFISDFLSCDEFEFVPSSVESGSSKGDFGFD